MNKYNFTLEKIGSFKPILTILLLLFLTTNLSAQSEDQTNILPLAILLIIGALILAVVFLVADNFLANFTGGDRLKRRDSFFPGLTKWLKPKAPSYVSDDESFTVLKQGYNIRLDGEARPDITEASSVTRFAVQPSNFRGIRPIPKMVVEVGDEVKAGQPLFFDKDAPDVKYVAPVSGEVVEINRGAKRAIIEVVILADKEIQYAELPSIDLDNTSQAELAQYLQASGFWPHIIQRPFSLVPETEVIPENIFISTFDTAPLAPDMNFVVEGQEGAFHKGLEVLTQLTSGAVHLGISANGDTPHQAFLNAPFAQKHFFKGPHPCGNVGIQIHHIAPIGKGEKVWTLTVQDVITLGNLFLHHRYDVSRVVALTGEIENPSYVRTRLGANIGELLKGENLEEMRIISGDVLSGKSKTTDQYLNQWDDQVSVISEGDYYELFGWLVPGKARPSVSKTYPNFLFKDLKYKADTNTHGEKRAFVVTDQYEQLLPMDIYPQHLMKAIMTQDIEKMEGLGIYELTEEDIALAEFACTSKMPLQKILREGQEMMQEQL